MEIIKQIVDCILDGDHILSWAHVEVLELNNSAKEILGKVPTFDLLKPLRGYIKKCNSSVPQVQFIDEFDFVVERK